MGCDINKEMTSVLLWGIRGQAAGWAGGQSGEFPTVAPWRCNESPSPEGCLVDWCHTGSLQSEMTKGTMSTYRCTVLLQFTQNWWWATLKQIPTHLCSQIWDANELLEDVLGQDVGVARLLDVIRRHIDVVGSEMEVGCGYSPEGGEEKGTYNRLVIHLPQ